MLNRQNVNYDKGSLFLILAHDLQIISNEKIND